MLGRRRRDPVRRLRRGDQGDLRHGRPRRPAGLLTPWLLVCVAASVAAFYASAKGLQDGDAVPVIAVTGTAANVAGIVGGFIVFGDPLPAQPDRAGRPVPRLRAGGRRGVADAGAGPRASPRSPRA